MALYIEITQEPLIERSGNSNGRAYHIREQLAYLHKSGQPYPDKIRVQLERDQQPYAPGGYELDESSFYPDRYGKLAVRPKLKPRQVTQSKSA